LNFKVPNTYAGAGQQGGEYVNPNANQPGGAQPDELSASIKDRASMLMSTFGGTIAGSAIAPLPVHPSGGSFVPPVSDDNFVGAYRFSFFL
jgi:hypothetical protein